MYVKVSRLKHVLKTNVLSCNRSIIFHSTITFNLFNIANVYKY